MHSANSSITEATRKEVSSLRNKFKVNFFLPSSPDFKLHVRAFEDVLEMLGDVEHHGARGGIGQFTLHTVHTAAVVKNALAKRRLAGTFTVTKAAQDDGEECHDRAMA